MSQKIDQYFDKRTKNPHLYKESYLISAKAPAVLQQAFNFYGGYVSLSQKEKSSVAESQIVTYYKQCIIDLEVKNHVLESEIGVLRDMNVRYYGEMGTARERVGI